MKEKGETLGERIRRVRGEMFQAGFGKALGVSQGTVSAWERDDKDRGPSAEMYFRLATLASDPKDSVFFLKQAGLREEDILRVAREIFAERTAPSAEIEILRLPWVRRTIEGTEDTGHVFPVARILVPNPDSAMCLEIDKSAATATVPAGNLILLDTSDNNAADLRPFEYADVLAQNDLDRHGMPSPASMIAPHGLVRGCLRFRLLKSPHDVQSVPPENRWLVWVATVGPFDDFETEWQPSDKAAYVGDWYAVPEPRCKSDLEWDIFCIESRKQAPSKIQLIPSCRILGRVIGCFTLSSRTK